MTKELFDQLATLRIQEREIKSKIDEIYPQVLEEVADAEDGTVIESDLGNFTVSFRRNWEYPELIQEFESEVKKKKKLAEQTGEATYEEKACVIFSRK
jgi:hypothetical protein